MKLIPWLALVASWGGMAHANFCPNGTPFGSSTERAWRDSETHLTSNVDVATSSTREAEIQKVRQAMENEILGVGMPGDTPPIEFIAGGSAVAKYLAHTNGVKGYPTKIAISGIGSGGMLEGTLLLPASGHTGAANARLYAKQDTYTVHMEVSTDAAGKTFGSYDGSAGPAIIKDAKSLGLVTMHDIAIQLVAGKVVRLYYFRSGSGGPAGYFEGRVIDLVWDGT